MSSDGINIAGSHNVTATGNSCSGTVISAGAHPDCIQMWSIAGRPVQSDITLSKNIINGPTQGLTSFTEANGGGLRISIIDNIIATSYPQGIACYGCVDSIITGNILTTLAGARWRTSINVFNGRNNIVANNSVGAKPPGKVFHLGTADLSQSIVSDSGFSGPVFTEGVSSFASGGPDVLTGLDNRLPSMRLASSNPAALAAVPEPATWAQLIFGFTMIGFAARRRSLLRSGARALDA